jgi:hypothetical protein
MAGLARRTGRRVGDQWVGDLGAAEALTRADLAVMPGLVARLDDKVSQISTVTHKALFVGEDEVPPTVAGFLHYHAGAPLALLKLMTKFLIEGGGEVAGPVSLELKVRMQRPRPYQVALLVDPSTSFSCLVAKSATTPSLVSGHCLQGAMALVFVVYRLEELRGAPLDPALLAALQQFFIDGGDRRVFAGVHYPSDNISSWYCGLRLCRHVCRDPSGDPELSAKVQARAREVLWGAVKASLVYQAIASDTAFAKPLQVLGEAAANG